MCDKRKHTSREARDERRAYRCALCGWWHLTSEPVRQVKPYRRAQWRIAK